MHDWRYGGRTVAGAREVEARIHVLDEPVVINRLKMRIYRNTGSATSNVFTGVFKMPVNIRFEK
jgi:hypothetical protein